MNPGGMAGIIADHHGHGVIIVVTAASQQQAGEYGDE